MILLFKPLGLTPLETIRCLRKKHPEFSTKKIGYAGRLDPMAEGLLLLLVDRETKERTHYERLSKIYEAEIVFGMSTDTHDIMGIITNSSTSKGTIEKKVIELLPGLLGKHIQEYPAFSSRRVRGKPLFYWARQNKLSEITIPSKEIEIYSITILSSATVTDKELLSHILTTIKKAHGNFRQREIIHCWNKTLSTLQHTEFPVIKLEIRCSSGTYIRSLAHEIGKRLDTPSLLLSLKRTQIGDYTLQNALHL